MGDQSFLTEVKHFPLRIVLGWKTKVFLPEVKHSPLRIVLGWETKVLLPEVKHSPLSEVEHSLLE